MSIEWQIIFLATIAASAYFSYQTGHKHGISDGIESCLDQLAAQGVIELEEEPYEP
jgi:hypothetical protein